MMMMMMIFVVMVVMLTCDCTLMVVCSGSWWRERELKRAWCKFAANTRPLWTWKDNNEHDLDDLLSCHDKNIPHNLQNRA